MVFDLSGLDAKIQYQVILSDLYGRTVATKQIQGGEIFSWNAAALADGQYLYQVLAETEIVRSGNLLKINK